MLSALLRKPVQCIFQSTLEWTRCVAQVSCSAGVTDLPIGTQCAEHGFGQMDLHLSSLEAVSNRLLGDQRFGLSIRLVTATFHPAAVFTSTRSDQPRDVSPRSTTVYG